MIGADIHHDLLQRTVLRTVTIKHFVGAGLGAHGVGISVEELKRFRLFGVYILTSLLICFAAPAFLEHARYGFPIIMVVPFVFFFTLVNKDKENAE